MDQQRHRGEAAIGHPAVAKTAVIGIAHPRW